MASGSFGMEGEYVGWWAVRGQAPIARRRGGADVLNERREFSEYKAMWLVAMFDLPVETKEDRREYAKFRKALLREGFVMLQFSVYARYCESEERTKVYRRRVRMCLPPDGEVRVLSVTDRQFGKMEVYSSKKRRRVEQPPPQLVLF